MKSQIENLVSQALAQLVSDDVLPDEQLPAFTIERTRDASHGDFATNAALVCTKLARSKPRDLAEKLAPAEKAWVHLRIRFCFFSYHLDVGLSSIAFSDRSQTAPKTGLAEEISRMIVDATAQEDGARPQN